MSQPDVGAQDPDATFDDDYYYHEGAYYYVEAADDQEELGGSHAGGLAFLINVSFAVAFLRQNLSNLCLYSDIVASADSCVFELMYSSPRGPWLVI